MNKKSLVELLKSAARYVWFGLLGVVVAGLTALIGSPEVIQATVTIAGMEVSVGVLIVAIFGTIIKALDLYIHKNKNIDLNGLAPAPLQK